MRKFNRGETAATADVVARNPEAAPTIGHGTPVEYISPRNPFPTTLDGARAEPLSSFDTLLHASKLSGADFSIQAITATFTPGAGILTAFADSGDNDLTFGRNAAGTINVNGGAVPVLGGTPTVANTTLIQAFGQGGNDVITLDETSGALPRANLFGGTGNDVLTGGSGGDQLFGQSGNDTLLGKGGTDFLFGGSDNDTLTGGDGDDRVFGESGNDRMIWNPGDDTDLFEGGAGIDTAEVNGGGGAENFTTTANGTRVRFDRLDPAPFALDIGTTENLVVNMNGGDDTFSATGNLAALIKITVDGGAGNDTILGSNGIDLLLGGDGNDFIDGQQGNDVSFLGAGNDVFQWDPGDGSDTIEGQAGSDTMLFNGSAGSEIFDASANGARVRFTRNLGNIVMDLDEVETIELNALGGTDTVTVRDLSGTDIDEVNIDLAATIGGTAGDAAADTVITNATNGNNDLRIVGGGTSYSVKGLPTAVNVSNAEGANDTLVVNALGGNDTINAADFAASITKLTLDGGAGNDTIRGGQGNDVILGGDGNDFIDGNQCNDIALMGAGDDVFQWDPGDGSDTVEGQAGQDKMLFFGSGANENFDVSAVGGRVRFFRDVGNITMDLDDLEKIELRALGGTDNVVIGDLSGTDVTDIDVDLRGANGGGDGAADTITSNATQGADVFGVTGDAGGIRIFGLQASVDIFHQEVANDRLTLNGLGGDDVIDATSLEADGIQLTMNGGLGADVLLGSEGDDLINGGDGDDLASMGAGDDTFVWNPGDDNDTIEGQAGFDTMLFNGSNAAENVTISANEDRVQFFRNVANVTMDLDEVEAIDFNALGGADTIVVDDLSGTDIAEINLNLAGANGAGDAQPDTIIINATSGDDVVQVFGDASGVTVIGLGQTINITGFEAANDRIVINTLAGDDVVEASGLSAGSIQLTANGGDDDDVLIGGGGNDVLIGGNGDDVLLGGPGIDVLDGEIGDDIEIQLVADPVLASRIDLSGGAASYDWLLDHTKDVGDDAVIDVGAQQFMLRGVSTAELM
jgi:Ca2+-binding RTX toxin-like protein